MLSGMMRDSYDPELLMSVGLLPEKARPTCFNPTYQTDHSGLFERI